jgi:hypothetical protein
MRVLKFDRAITGKKPSKHAQRARLDQLPSEPEPQWTKLELESVKSMRECEELTSLDRDTLMDVYGQWIVRLSPRRYGMKLKNLPRIMSGEAAAALADNWNDEGSNP